MPASFRGQQRENLHGDEAVMHTRVVETQLEFQLWSMRAV